MQTAQRTWPRILSIVLEEELKVLDFVSQLYYYYFVLLDCFPFFLHILSSLSKVFLQTKCRWRTWVGFYSGKALEFCPVTEAGDRKF